MVFIPLGVDATTAEKMKFSMKDFFAFTEEVLNGKLHFLYSVLWVMDGGVWEHLGTHFQRSEIFPGSFQDFMDGYIKREESPHQWVNIV